MEHPVNVWRIMAHCRFYSIIAAHRIVCTFSLACWPLGTKRGWMWGSWQLLSNPFKSFDGPKTSLPEAKLLFQRVLFCWQLIIHQNDVPKLQAAFGIVCTFSFVCWPLRTKGVWMWGSLQLLNPFNLFDGPETELSEAKALSQRVLSCW